MLEKQTSSTTYSGLFGHLDMLEIEREVLREQNSYKKIRDNAKQHLPVLESLLNCVKT